jgi:hypothetical protein
MSSNSEIPKVQHWRGQSSHKISSFKASSMTQAYLRDMLKNALKSVCTLTIVVIS